MSTIVNLNYIKHVINDEKRIKKRLFKIFEEEDIDKSVIDTYIETILENLYNDLPEFGNEKI